MTLGVYQFLGNFLPQLDFGMTLAPQTVGMGSAAFIGDQSQPGQVYCMTEASSQGGLSEPAGLSSQGGTGLGQVPQMPERPPFLSGIRRRYASTFNDFNGLGKLGVLGDVVSLDLVVKRFFEMNRNQDIQEYYRDDTSLELKEIFETLILAVKKSPLLVKKSLERLVTDSSDRQKLWVGLLIEAAIINFDFEEEAGIFKDHVYQALESVVSENPKLLIHGFVTRFNTINILRLKQPAHTSYVNINLDSKLVAIFVKTLALSPNLIFGFKPNILTELFDSLITGLSKEKSKETGLTVFIEVLSQQVVSLLGNRAFLVKKASDRDILFKLGSLSGGAILATELVVCICELAEEDKLKKLAINYINELEHPQKGIAWFFKCVRAGDSEAFNELQEAAFELIPYAGLPVSSRKIKDPNLFTLIYLREVYWALVATISPFAEYVQNEYFEQIEKLAKERLIEKGISQDDGLPHIQIFKAAGRHEIDKIAQNQPDIRHRVMYVLVETHDGQQELRVVNFRQGVTIYHNHLAMGDKVICAGYMYWYQNQSGAKKLVVNAYSDHDYDYKEPFKDLLTGRQIKYDTRNTIDLRAYFKLHNIDADIKHKAEEIAEANNK